MADHSSLPILQSHTGQTYSAGPQQLVGYPSTPHHHHHRHSGPIAMANDPLQMYNGKPLVAMEPYYRTANPRSKFRYRIALNFQGSKFSRIVSFVEMIMGVAFKPDLSNMYSYTVIHSSYHSCQQSNVYSEGISLERMSCGFGSLAPRCDVPAVRA